jgi:hypothetical protein
MLVYIDPKDKRAFWKQISFGHQSGFEILREIVLNIDTSDFIIIVD